MTSSQYFVFLLWIPYLTFYFLFSAAGDWNQGLSNITAIQPPEQVSKYLENRCQIIWRTEGNDSQ